jgi:DNA-binding XRE family transcriptional regulator
MTVQLIPPKGKPEFAILPYDDYLKLIEKAEMLEDVRDFEQAMEDFRKSGRVTIPGEVVFALIDGANPIKTWREYRGLSQNDLAQQASISIPYLSQLEASKRKGSLKVLSSLAQALQLSLEDLLPANY